MGWIEYQDLILLGIAASLLGGFSLALLTPVELRSGVFMGSAIATVFIYDAVFRNPPLPESDPRLTVSTIVWHIYLLLIAVSFLV